MQQHTGLRAVGPEVVAERTCKNKKGGGAGRDRISESSFSVGLLMEGT